MLVKLFMTFKKKLFFACFVTQLQVIQPALLRKNECIREENLVTILGISYFLLGLKKIIKTRMKRSYFSSKIDSFF